MTTTLHYLDPEERFSGYLVYDRDDCLLAAGGCRVQPGLTPEALSRLADNMALKQRVLGLNVDGAKCGIDYDPRDGGAVAALGRFVCFLRTELARRFSMGSDMGSHWPQLERLARAAGVPSTKYSIKTAQGFSDAEFFARLRVLDEAAGPMTLGQRRAGHVLAQAARLAAGRAGVPADTMTVALQGFGNLGRAAACAFAEWGTTVVAVADEYGCVRDPAGLDVWRMLKHPSTAPLRDLGRDYLERDAVTSTECDLLVLAAAADAISPEHAAALPCSTVVVGANGGLSEEVEDILRSRGILVIPDFIGGIGGSASMEVLFGSRRCLDARGALTASEHLMAGLLEELLGAARPGESTRQAGLRLAAAHEPDPEAPPYGSSPYLESGQQPRRSLRPGPHSAAVSDERRCAHTRAHVVDSSFFGRRYSSAASREAFCDVCRVQRWLDVEAALATAQGELGIIPMAAAEQIVACARSELLDLDLVREQTRTTGHSLVGLLRVFQAVCPGTTGEFVHYGATTQDIQDTAQSLEMRDVLDSLDGVLDSIVAELTALARAHASSPALGRTHAQPALPFTFGLKVAGWLDELLRHRERIDAMRPRVLSAQLFGGVGTLAGFGPDGPALVVRFAERLGLSAPSVCWHVARDRVAEFVTTLSMVAASMARIADEVRVLSRPEFGEMVLGWTYGTVGSSTMPSKRNPELCEQVSVMATLAAAQVGPALAAMRPDHERDSRALRLEWACVADVSHYCLAAGEMVDEVLATIQVDEVRLAANLAEVSEQVITERLMLVLGQCLGKQTAHERVYELSQQARSTGDSLRRLVEADPGLRHVVPTLDLEMIFDPTTYTGHAEALTNRVLLQAGGRP
jgi:adenylosuccinate lyase/glutamate dehydrogenase/leucine dehydrogenase